MKKSLFFVCLFGLQTLIAQNFNGGPGNGYSSSSTGKVAIPSKIILAGNFTGVSEGSTAWGDYDADGRLDLLLTGFTSPDNTSPVSKIYHNTGSGFTEVYTGTLTGVAYSSVAWGDYDNDGDLDILLTGSDGSNPVSKIYRNNGTGFSEVFAGQLSPVAYGSVAWGDADNDGDLDILLSGQTTGLNYISKIYQNTGNGFSEVYAGSLTGVYLSSVAWGDADNNGKLDILLTGHSSSGQVSKIYQNTGSGFSEIYAGSITPVEESSVAWGDYDNDGDLDILLTGYNGTYRVSKLYNNSGTGFNEAFPGYITNVMNGSVNWGDIDNDGISDFLITGAEDGDGLPVSILYQINGSTIIPMFQGSLSGVINSASSLADFDNDGDLDILVTGTNDAGDNISYLYENQDTVANTPPSVPSNLNAQVNGSEITLTWDQATDAETPANGLTYNIYLYENGNGNFIVPPQAIYQSGSLNGYQLIAKMGDILWDASGYTLNISGLGDYSWSIQAVDAGFSGSDFAPENSFTINCQANFSAVISSLDVAFTNLSSGVSTNYLWYFGDDSYSTETNPAHLYQAPGYYEVCLTTYDAGTGCMNDFCSTLAVLDTVTNLCRANFTYFVSNDTVQFTNTSQGDITNILWDFGDGNYSVLANPEHLYNEPGDYTACLIVFNFSTDCMDQYCSDIVIVDTTIATCEAKFIHFTEDKTVYFTSQSTGNNEFFWDFGDGGYDFTPEPVHTYSFPDYYEVCLYVYNSNNGCLDYTCKTVVITDTLISTCLSRFEFLTDNKTVYFNSSSTGNITDYFWNFGDGSYAITENAEHTYVEAGYYEVGLTVYNDTTGCLDDYYTVVVVIDTTVALCNARFTYYPNNYQISFKSEAVGQLAQIFWDFGDGFTSNDTNPVHIYETAGYYDVCLSVIDTNTECFDTRCMTIYVQGTTVVDIVKAEFAYFPLNGSLLVQFNDQSLGTPDLWYWDFGDNTPALTDQNPQHLYDTNNYYRVCLTVQNDVSQNTKCKFIAVGDVSNRITAYFTYFADTITSTAHFRNQSLGNIASYLWEFGDGNTSVQKNPSHTYADTGHYAVCLTVNSTTGSQKVYCSDIRVGNALVNPCTYSCVWPGDANSDLEANHYDIMTLGLNYGMTGPWRENASNLWYGQFAQNWSTYQLNGVNNKHGDCNGDGEINMDDTLAIFNNFAYSHYYQPQGAKTNEWEINCVWDTTAFPPKAIGRKATAKLDPPAGKPAGDIYALGYEIEVINGQGIIFSGIKVNFGGSWIGTQGQNMITVTKLDSINQLINIGMTRIDHQNITGAGNIASITFPLLPGFDGSGVTFRVHTLGGIINNGVNIGIAEGFTIDLGPDISICSGDSATLSVAEGYQTYQWSEAGAPDTNSITITKSGMYYVTVTDNGITRIDSLIVTVNPLPTTILADKVDICPGSSDVLHAGPGFTGYLWTDGSTDSTLTVSAAGIYFVTVTNEFSCTSIDTATVSLLTPPVVDLGANRYICEGQTTTLDAGPGMTEYLWNTLETTQTIVTGAEGTYIVVVTGQNTCTSSDSVYVTVNPVPDVFLGDDFEQQDSAVLDAGVGFSSYLWSTGETTQTIVVKLSDNYWVRVTNLYECEHYDTIHVTIYTGIAENNAIDRLQVFPNPNSGTFEIRLDSKVFNSVWIELYNTEGQMVYRKDIDRTNSFREKLDLSFLRKGLYNLRIVKGNAIRIEKVVIE